jgi:methylenetetrahydrofolate--tRNA-(uracil-5-)-methyltransferase
VHERTVVVGAGIAGTEAAWQLASRGVPVRLVEMRPRVLGPAHRTGDFAELVCSNSFKSQDPNSAAGALKRELEALGSIVMAVARDTSIPAGSALAVDRERFSRELTAGLASHPLVEIDRREATRVPDGDVVVATGPLTSDSFASALSQFTGPDRLSFFDAASPIVDADSVDPAASFRASRYDKGGGADYVNCPLDEAEFAVFREALVSAERVVARPFEGRELFAGCEPVEETARRGPEALTFGAMKPVGLEDPRTGARPFAVVQLRAENAEASAYNLVGFQTNLTFSEQRRVFTLIPALAGAEFLRYGVMHRNTFLDAPRLLDASLRLRGHPRVRIAGQLTGTEGYLEAAATGLLAALDVAAARRGVPPFVLPRETVLGALVAYATDPQTSPYQPMHVNFGLLPRLDPPVSGKRRRYEAYSVRAAQALRIYVDGRADLLGTVTGDGARSGQSEER